jgi:nucleotide-binding universal stress UspA family protein
MLPEIKKILLATDLSESSRASLTWAMTLAQKHNASLLMVNVIEEIGSSSPSLQFYLSDEEWNDLKQRINKDATDKMKKQLTAFCEEIKADIPDCSYVADEIIVTRGIPVEKIISTATDRQCDIIVMGTLGAGGVVGAIMGSTARRVLRRSKIPVFVVPHARGDH